MPRYFFNCTGGPPDSEGTEIASLAEAKCVAVKMAGNIICDSADQFWDDSEWQLTVTDQAGLTLFSLLFLGVEAPAISQHDRSV